MNFAELNRSQFWQLFQNFSFAHRTESIREIEGMQQIEATRSWAWCNVRLQPNHSDGPQAGGYNIF
jgi:hypothetical protein